MVTASDLTTLVSVLVTDNVLEWVLQDNISVAHPVVLNVQDHQLDKSYAWHQVLDAASLVEPSLLVMLPVRLALEQRITLVLLATLDSF